MTQLPPDLQSRIEQWRAEGKAVVFTNGVFDILHAGHVEQLRAARAEGDVLIVGLNSDASVRRQGKGEDRPILAEGDRRLLLEELRSVDAVALFDEDTPLELIAAVQPDVLVKGEDYAGREVVGREIVEARGGKVVLVPLVPGHSTTAIVEKIRRGRGS